MIFRHLQELCWNKLLLWELNLTPVEVLRPERNHSPQYPIQSWRGHKVKLELEPTWDCLWAGRMLVLVDQYKQIVDPFLFTCVVVELFEQTRKWSCGNHQRSQRKLESPLNYLIEVTCVWFLIFSDLVRFQGQKPHDRGSLLDVEIDDTLKLLISTALSPNDQTPTISESNVVQSIAENKDFIQVYKSENVIIKVYRITFPN